MICWRCFVACGFITLSTLGCGDGANSTGKYSQQVVQETNVAKLLKEANVSQKAQGFLKEGNNLFNSHRYGEAIAAYDKALSINPDIADAWINRGNALTALQFYQEALVSFDKAIMIEPKKQEAWFNRGNALTKLQRVQDALAAYDKVIAIKSNSSDAYDAWINRGITLVKLKRYTAALASYDKAIALNPNKQEAYYNKACAYALQNNLELAIENLQKAIKVVPQKYKQLAKTDSDFDKLRKDKQFQELIQ